MLRFLAGPGAPAAAVVVVIIAAVMALAVGAASLWALNTLFALGLAYSLKNAAAAALLAVVVGGAGRSKS